MMISGAYPPGQEVVNLANDAQNTADLSGSPLTAVDDQIFPTNLADIVTDGTFCVRNVPADVAAFGLADHIAGDVLKKVGATWKRLLRPGAGTTFIWLIVSGKPAVFVDEPVAGNLPLFVNTLDTGEAFSVPYIGTNLPGQISFDGILLTGNTVGGLTTANFGNSTLLILSGTVVVWIRDTVNPERSGVYNLIVNNAGTGDYILRRDYNFRDSSSFIDGQTFFVGSGTGGDEANKNYLISLTQQFIINTTSLAIVEGTIANLTQVSSVATEEFANTDGRFFGELGVPDDQAGWLDVANAPATITIDTQEVFGVTKNVVKHFDDGSGSTGSQFALSVQNWVDINDFGASYGGIARLDTFDGGNGFFTGLQANAAENPLVTGNRRYGFTFNKSGGFLQVVRVEGGAVLLDGTSGNPKVLFDEFFKWECVVPAGLGAAQFFINDILTTLAPLFAVNSGGLGSHATVSSGSSSGTDRIAYHDNFGVTIYEEGPTKTFSAASMQKTTAIMLIPPGRRDYTVIVPDGNPQNLGDVLAFTLQNVGGKLTLKTQDVLVPQSLFTSLNELVKVTNTVESIALINTVANANIYEFSIPPIQPDELSPSFVSTADATVGNTTVANTIIGTGKGTLTLEGNSVAVGDCFNFRAGGIFSAGANPTLRLKLKLGALTAGDSGDVVISNVTNAHWVLEGTATIRSIGATGTISVEGGFTTSAGDHFDFVFLVPTIVDFTQNNNADITAQWGTASAGNTITGQNVSIIKMLSP